VRTLHVGLHVADRAPALRFYEALGYAVVGSVPDTPIGHLTMLALPDDEFVTLELVHDPDRGPVAPGGGGGLSHLVVQVESLSEVVDRLAAVGAVAEPPSSPDGSGDFLTAMVSDPDGHRIELVQWPAGHAAGMTADDFA
jgi:lactoylglutathione lyase